MQGTGRLSIIKKWAVFSVLAAAFSVWTGGSLRAAQIADQFPGQAQEKSVEAAHGTAAKSGSSRPVRIQPFMLSAQSAIEAENNAFGSMPIPIGGGEFAPYLGENAVKTAPSSHWFPTSLSELAQQDFMTGEWGGYRQKLRDRGLDFGGRWLMEWVGNPTGGRSQSARYSDEEAIFMDMNFKKLTGYNLGIFHFLTIGRQVSGVGNTLPQLNSPMEIYGASTHKNGTDANFFRIGRFSWEMIWNRYVRTEAGEINTETDFEQSSNYWGANLYCQFVNNGICGMPQSIAMNSGYGFYPSAHPGAWVKFYPAGNDHWLVSGGIYSVSPKVVWKQNAWQFGLHQATGAYVPVQLGWHRGGPTDYSGPLQTNIKLGAYWDSSSVGNVYSQLGQSALNSAVFTHDVMNNPAVNQAYLNATCGKGATACAHHDRNRHGFWVQADQMLERDADDPRRGLAFFGSYTYGNMRDSILPSYMTLGLVRKGTFKSRPDDTISLGMKAAWVNSHLRNWVQNLQRAHPGIKGLYAPSNETTMEFDYGYRPIRWFLIRPDIQYSWGAGGTHRYGNAFMLGMQSGVVF